MRNNTHKLTYSARTRALFPVLCELFEALDANRPDLVDEIMSRAREIWNAPARDRTNERAKRRLLVKTWARMDPFVARQDVIEKGYKWDTVRVWPEWKQLGLLPPILTNRKDREKIPTWASRQENPLKPQKRLKI